MFNIIFKGLINLIGIVISYFSAFFLLIAKSNCKFGDVSCLPVYFSIFIIVFANLLLWYTIYWISTSLEDSIRRRIIKFSVFSCSLAIILFLVLGIFSHLNLLLKTDVSLYSWNLSRNIEGNEKVQFGDKIDLIISINNLSPFTKTVKGILPEVIVNHTTTQPKSNLDNIRPFRQDSFKYTFNILDEDFDFEPGRNTLSIKYLENLDIDLFIEAVLEEDNITCDQIVDYEKKVLCFEGLIKSEVNIENCNKIKDYLYKSVCYSTLKNCEDLENQDVREDCYNAVGRTGEYEYCAEISNKIQRQQCLDYSCERVSVDKGSDQYKECIIYAALNLNDVKFCAESYDEEIEAVCINQFYTEKYKVMR